MRLGKYRLNTKLCAGVIIALALPAQPVAAIDLSVTWQRGGHTGGCTRVTFSPDGTEVVSASWDATIKFWRPSDGQLLRTWQNVGGRAAVLTYLPDGAHIAVGIEYVVEIRNLATGTVERSLTEHFSLVSDIELTPDGQWAATLGSFDGQAFLRRTSDWSVVYQFPKPPGISFQAPLSIEFSPDGSSAYISAYDGQVNEYQVADGAFLRTLGSQSLAPAFGLALSPDGSLLLAGDADGVIRRWSLPSGTALPDINAHTDEIRQLTFSQDGLHFLSASFDGTARLWRTADGALLQTLSGHTDGVVSAALSPDGTQIVTGADYDDSNIRLWNAADGQLLRTLTSHADWVRGIAFHPDGTALASGGEGVIRIWDAATGDALGDVPAAHDQEIRDLAFSPDGMLLASCASGSGVKLWSYPQLAFVGSVPIHMDFASKVAFSPDGAWLASVGRAAGVYSAKLVRVSDWQLVHTLTGYPATPNALAFSPDSAILAAAGGEVIKLWRVSDGALLETLTGHTSWVSCLEFSPDGAVLASTGPDRTIRLWNTADGNVLRVLTGAEQALYTLAFAGNGRTLVTAGWDDSLAVWRVSDGELLLRYDSPLGKGLAAMAFSPDGLQLALGRIDATVVAARRPSACGGDLDLDGDIDAADYADMAACLAGPQVTIPPSPACSPENFIEADLDADGDVDLADHMILQQVFTGAGP